MLSFQLMDKILAMSTLSQKLKQLRMAKGWTLEQLSAQMGGIVTKQALSKYEKSLDMPSPKVLTRLASTFNVKSAHLVTEPSIKINFVAYRKRSDFRKGDQVRIESQITLALEDRIRLQNIEPSGGGFDVPIQSLKIRHLDEAESAAEAMRKKWQLGSDAIAHVSSVLEDNGVHVLNIDADERFDGISAIAYADNKPKGAAVVIRKGVDGGTQRLNIAHELAHLILNVSSGVDCEKAAFRFGGAFLAPRAMVLKEVGTKRSAIQLEELLLLKKRFGMSIQALLYRLKDLEIISEAYYSEWFATINKFGWKKAEPRPLPQEKSEWLKQRVSRAFAEGLLSYSDAEKYLGAKPDNASLPVEKVHSFVRLPIDERRKLLREAVFKMAPYYNQLVDAGAE